MPDTFLITDLNVKLDITQARDSDLVVFLIAPDGTRIQLFSNVGGTGKNFTSTVLDDQATTAITGGAAPFTGTFKPMGSLAAANTKSMAGVWTLEVTDGIKGQTGKLNSWSLTFEY